MAEIEGEIARARVEFDHTLDELAAELAPKRLVEKAGNMVAKSWSKHRLGATGLGRTDAVPLALIGLGAAWLVAENAGLLSRIVPGRGERKNFEKSSGADAVQASPGNGSVRHAVGEARGVPHPIDERSGIVLERTDECLEKAGPSDERACAAGNRLTGGIERNPLLFGLAGIVCGVVAAMLAPSSRRERELIAGAREELWKTAEELGHRAADCVRATASEQTDIAGTGRTPGLSDL
jgi:Protein of unknown function (DUF3618)